MKISTIKYFSMDSLISLRRNKTLSIASIITVSLTLFMFGIFLLTMLNANQLLKNLESKLEVSVFLKENVAAAEKQKVASSIKNIQGVAGIKYITKTEALQKLNNQLGEENKDLMKGLDKQNPLPESFIIRVDNSSIIKSVVEKTKGIKSVEKVVANEDLVNQISKITKGVKWVGGVALLIMIPICLFLIGNTIKLAVYARRREVNIMKFVGATDWFIRWPFIIEGVIIGVIGALISSGLLYYAYKAVYLKLTGIIMLLNILTPRYFAMNIVWIFIISGIVIGGIGSILSIRKFLEV
ncbi:ABC transporter permease [Clostridium botulinum]|uniref:Cell division protein FtsX n=1 Tax=Clostridium botulinum C/D str. DC5 TaxID=1443128 RepID=A0A0A0IIG4_CLOBO|nr:permease-like cell division protein FtsX [Clostridium botulinum]KEI06910.1 cell division protein FtsX [Clostridium botulinum C/D str. BKT75002]KEI08206.1 cell division protein FtsX [Clostridium botulinum C/D str. BKT2873]KGM95754.1 cell division protein FtsX [Clostridium botulinum D str. CCUG 7971]KGN00404.1 cell division protein FtsX [Clostridium botulinum C/D str. DC5]KOC47998.1 cell division protein FtsX [Clostridium botulinum]